MDNVTLIIASFLAGIWNVIHEKFVSVKQSLCFFVLGFSFCYTAATIAESYGWDSKISTCVGYLCGMFSPSIYRLILKLFDKAPDLIEQKIKMKGDRC